MIDSPLEAVLRRDRAIVAAALAAIAGLAWFYLIEIGSAMAEPVALPGMGPSGMADMAMAAPHVRSRGDALTPALVPWSAHEFLLMFLMWAVMMAGMMTPSVAPMMLIYARVARQAQTRQMPFASTGWFALGYLLAWTGFAALATILQWTLEQAALLTPMMATASPSFGGALLIIAGIYQWTPLKEACLGQCQSPLLFIQNHGGFRGQWRSTLTLGLRHGAFCIGCCWGLMLLLFLGGVMNLLWIAGLAALVLIEKLVTRGRILARIVGIVFVAAGLVLIKEGF